MTKPKRLNPYQYLLREVKDFCRSVEYRHQAYLFRYQSAKDPSKSWNVSSLYQRVAAAEQLGYNVEVSTDGDDLRFKYVKKLPHVPYKWL